MRRPRLHVPRPLTVGELVELPPEQANKLRRTLRLGVHADVVLFDGSGDDYAGRIARMGRDTCAVLLHSRQPGVAESPLAVTLMQGFARGERMDFALQKAVELGIKRFLPLYTERSQVHLDARRTERRLAHWRAVAASACEQSGRSVLPWVEAPVDFATAMRDAPPADVSTILDGRGDPSPWPGTPRPASINILVGPEGGFSAAEFAAARAAGYLAWRIGPRVLRTETAGVAAVTALQITWGDLSGARDSASCTRRTNKA